MSYLIILTALACITASSATSSEEMDGGFTPLETDDPSLMEKAWRAAQKVNKDPKNDCKYALFPVKVLKAESQVVAGVNYEIEVLYQESACRRSEVDLSMLERANCAMREEGRGAIYKISVYERPWEDFEQISVSKLQDINP